jgi:branched-chain amino acid transport system ATP-binding protein
MSAILAIRDLTVRFGGVVAVDNVNFDVAEGQLLGLIGPNGAGKTTVMRSITGIVTPETGEIRLQGAPVQYLPTHQRVRAGLGFSQQLVRPFRSMSLFENVRFTAGYAKTRGPLGALVALDRSAEARRALELLDLVGIAEQAEARPDAVPLGVLKRLEVARALALDPKVLLLDEPLAGLNSEEAATLADTIRALNGEGFTVILIEHNLGEVMRICDRLIVLDNGRLIGEGAPRDVMAEPTVRAAYLGTEAPDAAA